MFRVHRLRGFAVCAFLLFASSTFAASFTSVQSGNWNDPNTWGGSSPLTGDSVVITSNHVVTVTGSEVILAVTLDSTPGNKMLVIDTGASLRVERAGGTAIAIDAPSPGNTNIVRINGGTLEAPNLGTNLSITGGAGDASRLEFTSLGGTATFADNLAFSGMAVIDFGPTAGTLEIGGDLGSGATFVHNSNSAVVVDGGSAQTINGYTFNHFTVNKGGGTATLNGPITVDGDFAVTSGVLDDGGNAISLNSSATSNVTIGTNGVLKIGSAASPTFFPSPYSSVTLDPNSSVVYQSGAPQTIDSSFAYGKLWLSTLGGTTTKTLSGATLTVGTQLDLWDNGLNTVTLSLAGNALDLDGDLSGDGTLSFTTGSMSIGGNFSALASLVPGTSLITYDGAGAQSVAGIAYHDVTINKTSGTATLAGNMSAGTLNVAAGTFDGGTNTINLAGDLSVAASALFTSSNTTIVLSGTAVQTLDAANGHVFGTLTVNNTTGATISGFNANVVGALNLNGGIVTASTALMIDVNATVSRTSGWITGALTMGMNPSPARTFHVGTALAYLPVTIDADIPGTITVEAVEGKHPDRTGARVIDRYWRLTPPATVTSLDSISFQYNAADVTTGTESDFILAQYDGGSFTFTHWGAVNAVTHQVSAANVTPFTTDWVIGHPGSLAAASQLAITDINGGTDPQINTPFDVVVEALDDNGDPAWVFANTSFTLSEDNGTGTLGGTLTGTINGGTDTVTVNGVTYDTAEPGLQLRATRTAGDVLTDGTLGFNVVAAPSTLTVTSINDSGPGTLREAITAANTGGCTAPCTIEFSTSGEINLASPLPAIALSDLTIDGYTAPGASANTNAYGQPSNAVITMAINGGGTVNFGFDIQETFVRISGFAIKNFTNAGVAFVGDNSGSNVSGCYIGTDVTGTIAAPNAAGVLFSGSAEASLGGMLPAARNVISGNTTWGVTTDAAANTISILGNYIGTNAALSAALPNNTGIKVCDGCSVSLGGSAVGNVVSGNLASGIVLAGNGTNVVAHFIGTAGSSNAAIPNATGIQIDSTASNVVIGGASPSDLNVISGNTQNAILLHGDNATIDNNLIGIAPDGVTARGNGGGIRIENTASNNAVGTSQGNKIAYNTNDGVTITGGIGNTVRKSKIAGNGNRAIDLGDDGTTANDATDLDTGANNLQNFPVLSEAKRNAGNVDVRMSLDSSGGVNANFFIFDVYKADASSPAQAIEYLGNSGCMAGNVFVNQLFSVPAGSAVVGSHIVATATAYSDAACSTPSEGTSELSASVRVGGDIHWIAGSGNWETPANWNPATVPVAGDTAYIDNAGTYTVTINSLASVGTLQLGAVSGTQTLAVAPSQSLTLTTGNSIVAATGILTLNGNGLASNGSALNVAGTLNWNGGSITGPGGVTIGTGSTLNIATAATKSLNASSITVGNGGTVNWLGGTIDMLAAATVDNFGLFHAQTDATINDAGGAGTFDNGGTFRKSATAGTTLFSNVTFTHTGGSVDLQTGTLNLAAGSASAPFAISSGATLLIDSHTYTMAAGADVTGAGKVHISGGTLAVDGPAVTIEHVQLDSGNLSGTGTVSSGANTWQWNGGNMTGGGTSVISSGGSLVIGTASSKTLNNRTLTTLGSSTTTVTGSGTIQFANGAALNNGGLFDTTTDVTLADSGAAGDIANSGTFRKSGGAGATGISNVDFLNSGTVEIQTGSFNPFNVTNSGAITLTGSMLVNDGTVTLSSGSDVSGSGLLQVAGGTLTVNTPDVLPNLQLDSGTVNGSAIFDVTSFAWTGGTLAGTGTTNVPNLAGATISSGNGKVLQRTLSVAAGGAVSVTGSGTISLSTGGNIANAGFFDYAADGTLADSGGDAGFLNTGTFRKSAGTGSTVFSNVDFTNNGTIDIDTGTFDPGNVTSTGTIDLTGTLVVNDSTVTLGTGTDVTGTGLVHVNGGFLTANAADTIPNLQLDGGTLNGTANVSIESLTWTNGSMTGIGTTTIPGSATATFSGASSKNLQRAFAILASGTMNVTGTGAINLGAGGTIVNDGLIDVTAAVNFGDAGSAGDVVNNRTFRTNHPGTTAFSNVTFDNNGPLGLIEIQNGALDLADGTSTAGIDIASGASFLINSNSYTFATGTTVGGAGTVSLTFGTLNVTGNVSVPNFAQTGGIVDGAGTLTLTNVANWSTGTMQGGGTTQVGAAGTLNLITPSGKTLGNRTLSSVAGGTINLAGNGSITLTNAANIANAGLMNITVDSTIADGGAAGNLVNTGTLRKQTATGPTTLSGVGLMNNGGIVDIQSGVINISGADTFTQTAGSLLKIWLNGTTPGTGFGQLTSNSSVNLAGMLEIALVGPYQPNGGDSFMVLFAPAHTGDFNQPYTYPALANSRTFSDTYNASGLLLTVNGNADLSISKTAPANVLAGSPIAYTLAVSNAGPDTANSVSVTDTLETGHTLISASGTGWTCGVVGLTVTCTAATLSTGAAPAITINATAPATPTTFTNVANVSSSNDSNGANNSGSAAVTVDALQANVAMGSTGSAFPVAPSTPFTFTFHLQNHGPQTASNVVFSATIPASLTYNSATPDAGTCSYAANVVTCNVGSISNGATLNVVLNLTTTATAGTQTVYANVAATENDPSPGNNTGSASVAVTGNTITVTSTIDGGMGSLREALVNAENGVCTPLPCTIDFNIPGPGPHVIAPVGLLPSVGNQILIDATTQPGYAGIPLVEIDGQPASLAYVFELNGTGASVRGLSITGATWGIDIHGDANTIEASYLGLDALGTSAPNGDGIRISGNNNVVGGTTAAQRNVISGNSSAGVFVEADGTGNTISGNFIGTDATGALARPNTVGVSITGDADNTTVGGATPAHGNVISGNADYGIYVEGAGNVVIAGSPSATAAGDGIVDDTGIRHNRIGPNAAGTSALGAGVTGIALVDHVRNTSVMDNVVSGNQNAITFSGPGSMNASVANNLIGLAPDGTTPMGNPQAGIIVVDGLGNTLASNQIAHNGSNGITLLGGQATRIQQNSIHDHSGLGIDIGGDGLTPNDLTDADSGPNGRQNFPTLGSVALTGGGNISITSSLDSSSAAGTASIRLEFFEADPSGEGASFIGSTCIAGNAFGVTTSMNAPGVAAGDAIVATATSFSDAACGTPADGTSEFSNVVVAANCTPPPVTIAGPTQMCAGATVVLDAGAGFVSYAWSNGATTRTISVSPAATTAYTVTVTDNLGCTNSDSHSVTVNPLPTVTITGPAAVCAGGSVTLDAGSGFASYAWSNGATSQTITVSPASTQSYTVTVTDGSSCQATDSHTVTVNPLPSVTITGPTSICLGGSVTLDAGPGFASYAWSNGATSQTITVAPASTQSYSVTVSNGTCSATDTHNVTVTANPTVPITAPPAACESSANNNASVAAQPGATYNWTIANGTITAGQGTNAVTFSAGPSGTVTLGITVTAASCVSTGSATVPIVTPPAVAITGPTSACAGSSVTLDAGAGFATYLWSNGATSRTITVPVNTTQTHSVTVSNAPGCSATDSHTITVTPAPSAVIDAPSPVTAKQSGLVASVAAQPGATYAWSITNGAINSGNGTHSIVFTAGASGLTKLHVTVTNGGCSTSFTFNVFIEGTSEPAEADLAVTKSAPATVQAGAAITYTIGIRNFGPGAAASVVLTDTLPSGTSYVTMNPGPWNCTRSGQTITCTGNASAGTNSTITVIVDAPQQAGLVTNVVSITSSTPDPSLGNNSASASTSVAGNEGPQCASAPPALLLPVDGASVASPATFSWSAVAGATEYELWVNDALEAVTGATSISRPLPSGTFSWFVVARFTNGCDPLASATRTVTILESSSCATNTAPVIRTPAPGTVNSPTTFLWTPVAQAIGYRLWIEADGTAAQDAGTTGGATSLSVDLPAGSLVAYVDALFSGCPPMRSPAIALTVPRPDPCAARATAQPLSPFNDAIVNSSNVEFAWTAAAGADGYRVWYSLDDAAPALLGNTTDATSLKASIGRGTVVWYVETLHDGCASTESQSVRFTIPARSECSQQKPEPLAPAQNANLTGPSIQFSWTSVPNAASYELWVSANDGASVLFGTTNNTTLTRNVPAGKVEWFVRAIVDRCGARDSQKSRFTHTPPEACSVNDRPLLVAPLGGATVSAPVRFDWSNAGASQYELFVIRGNDAPQLVATTNASEVDDVDIAPGKVRWFVRAHYGDSCPPLDSIERRLEVVPQPAACTDLTAPVVSAPGQISPDVPFLIQWTPVSGATAYQVLVADNAAFAGAAISTVTTPALPFQGANATSAPVLRYIRVRAIDARCQPTGISPYGPAHVLFILPKTGGVASAPFGVASVTTELDLGPQYAGQTFTATPKQPWITVTPSTGVVPASGIRLTVVADASTLPIGTSIGSISVAFASAAGGIATNDEPVGFPLGLSLVTPVTPTPANTPPPDALIIPAIAHADGINSHFQSDVRLSNTSAQLVTYQLTFTPSGDTGMTQGQQTTFSVEPGRTIALDDILKSWFATGSGSAIGTLEIRPLTQLATSTPGTAFTGLANLASFASSRTFNVTSNGTFGQYIPAIPFANFIGAQRILSLQQIAQSSRYRTNLGIVEGSGDPASVLVRMFGGTGQQIGQFPLSLNGGQHVQLNAFLRDHGIDDLTDGRVELEVVSEGGKITAYASVLDNQTSDPLLVTPVEINGGGATKWVVPGVADLASGFANWQTDMRVFNAGTSDVEAQFEFHSQNGGAPKTTTITIPAGQVRQFDKALTSLFGASNDGGAVHITTAAPARLIATARTYNQTSGGTYGQFISAVTPNEAAGAGDRPLQLLQVEETDRFRSNVGIVEVTGNPVRLEISAVPPDAKFTAVTELFLGPNEFRQLGSLLRSMGLADTHNARVTVRVVDGTGRITAYASVIDMLTNDPTYIPAQ